MVKGGCDMTFREFTDVCGNWHIQCNVSVVKYDHVLYEGEWCDMPKIIRKCYYINRFYVNSVEMKSFSLYVRLKPEYSDRLYNYLKYKYPITYYMHMWSLRG